MRVIDRHLELYQSGIKDHQKRVEIIRLEQLRADNFAAWVAARSRINVFRLIELAGEIEIDKLCRGRGGFERGELGLLGVAQGKRIPRC